jgi:hypothetical protein
VGWEGEEGQVTPACCWDQWLRVLRLPLAQMAAQLLAHQARVHHAPAVLRIKKQRQGSPGGYLH